MAYGPVEHIQQLIDSKIIEDLCYIINNTSEYKVNDYKYYRSIGKLHGQFLMHARKLAGIKSEAWLKLEL